MSCSCCCCVSPRRRELLEGIRKKERLIRGREEEEEEESRRNMDISLLREQYRSTRERQRRHTQVLLFRTVSEAIVPVTQGLTSPWEPNSSSPPSTTFDPDPSTFDPWHVHLGLHRRCCPGASAQRAASPPGTTNTDSSSRRSSSSSEDVAPTPDSPCSSSEASPCCSSSHTAEEDQFNPDRSTGDPKKIHVSVSGSLEQNLSGGSKEDHPDGSLSSSDESSTPVASVTCSTTSLHADLKENQSAAMKTSNGVLQTSSTSPWRGSRKFSAPALRFTRQLSVGWVGSSAGAHQSQNYHPFPNRKTPRISEAARGLGMYSSF